MKNISFVSGLLAVAVSLSPLFADSALADDKHKHKHQHRGHNAHHHRGHSHIYHRETYSEYGRVIHARPIYQRVAIDVPRESCQVRSYAQESRRGGDSFAGTVVGGLVGAAIGHEIGDGRGGATAVGGLIGASIGNNASKQRVVRYRDEEVCNTRYRTEYQQQLVGYDVSYSYLGRVYQTRSQSHPGDMIAVNTRSNYYPNY